MKHEHKVYILFCILQHRPRCSSCGSYLVSYLAKHSLSRYLNWLKGNFPQFNILKCVNGHLRALLNMWKKQYKPGFEKNRLPTLPRMQISHWMTSLESVYRITCSVLWSYKRLYTALFHIFRSIPKDLYTHLICRRFPFLSVLTVHTFI